MKQDRSQSPLTRKLAHFSPLSDEDIRFLDELGSSDERFEADKDVVREGEVPRSVFMLLEGMACRYRVLPDGGRQIMTFLIPGDLCDLHVFLIRAMDHSIGTLSPTRIAAVTREQVLNLAFRRPRISAALWWSSLQEEAILRERVVALGRRNALERVAYLLCELFWRHQAVGLVEHQGFALPLTQLELADTLGLTPVHVNRTLQVLRRQNLITLGNRRLVLLDIETLQKIAEFNKDYLHLGGAPNEIKSYFDMLERQKN